MVSERLRLELLRRRARGTRQYEIAREAQVHPVVLSNLINGMQPVRTGDPRIIRIGAVLGLQPEDCFESDNEVAGA